MKPSKTLAALAIAGAMLAPLSAPAPAQDATPAAECVAVDAARLVNVADTWSKEIFAPAPVAEMDALFTQDVVHHTGAWGDGLDLAGWQAARAELAAAYPDGAWTVDRTILDAPFGVVHWTADATHTGEFLGVPASGQPVRWSGINIYRFDDCGQIAEVWTEVDQFGRFEPAMATATPEATPAATSCGLPEGGDAEVEKLVEAWWATGWNADDATGFDEITDDGLIHHWASGPDTVGDEASMERVATWRAAMPDMKIAHEEILVDGNLAAARWTFTGTDTGGVMGAAPTGKAVSVQGINVFGICDGEIAEVWSEMDMAGMKAQLGG